MAAVGRRQNSFFNGLAKMSYNISFVGFGRSRNTNFTSIFTIWHSVDLQIQDGRRFKTNSWPIFQVYSLFFITAQTKYLAGLNTFWHVRFPCTSVNMNYQCSKVKVFIYTLPLYNQSHSGMTGSSPMIAPNSCSSESGDSEMSLSPSLLLSSMLSSVQSRGVSRWGNGGWVWRTGRHFPFISSHARRYAYLLTCKRSSVIPVDSCSESFALDEHPLLQEGFGLSLTIL